MAADTGIPFADGDDPDDAWDASDPPDQRAAVLVRRIMWFLRPDTPSPRSDPFRLYRIARDLARLHDLPDPPAP
jgi:hypothetical protein